MLLSKNENNKQEYFIPYLKNGLFGYCDTNKNIILEPKYSDLDFFDSFGFAKFKKNKNENSSFGLIDKNFNEIVKPIYNNIQTYSLFIIVTDTTELRNKQLLNSNGQILLKNQYSNIVVSNNFVKCVYQNRNHEMYKYNYLSKKLEHIITVKNGNAMFKYGTNHKVNYIYYYDEKDQYNSIDTFGNKLNSTQNNNFDNSVKFKNFSSNNIYNCKILRPKGVNNKLKGVEIYNTITKKTDSLSPIYPFLKIIYDNDANPYFILKVKKKYGLMNVNKKWVLNPEYDSITTIDNEYFSDINLLFKTKRNSRWRLYFENINHDEKINSFHELEYFENRFFITDLNAQKGLATIKNNKIVPIVKNSYLEIIQVYNLPNGKNLFKVEDFQKRIFWTDGVKVFMN